MTTISVNMVEHSINPYDEEIATFQLKYPRIIHGELMTHRVFSRNASSSRAIPTTRMISDIDADMALPIAYYSNKPGMQGGDLLSPDDAMQCERVITDLFNPVRDAVLELDRLQLHKQHKNRYLEPFQHISVLVTTTELINFFKLRIDKHAQPEIHILAKNIKECIDGSVATSLGYDGWHAPYANDITDIQTKLQCSTARCARVSFLNHDNTNPFIDKDIELHNILYTDRHMSPFEHVVRSVSEDEYQLMVKLEELAISSGITTLNSPYFVGNHQGFVSYRRLLEVGLA
jgi:thymidylate synthase ThyX